MNYDKTKYIVMFRDLIEEEVTIMKTDHSSLDKVEGWKYLGTVLTYHNSIQEGIKCRLNSVNASFHLL